ncbi:MAG: mechanosensitive ion channel family protein [Treponema sp.]|jgi:MscS family membrane protein|nr:mechanosensitive ion channel family protein [Treponema sp.]
MWNNAGQSLSQIVFLDNPLRQWIIAAAFIAGGLLAGKLCSLIASGVLKHVAHKTKSKIDDAVIPVTGRILTLLIFAKGLSLGIGGLDMNESLRLWINRGVSVLFILIIAGGVQSILDVLVLHYAPNNVTGKLGFRQTEIQPVLRKLFRAFIWALAVVFILKNLGYNISAILAGLGLGGAALALASRDTLANFFGSITVFLDRPFHFNDRIKIGGYDGYITEMGLRTSRIKTLENRTVIIPNSIFSSSPIENVSAEPHTRVTQTFGISRTCGTDKLEEAVAILKDIGKNAGGTDGAPQAGVISSGGAVCQVNFVYYVAKDADYLDTVNKVNFEILRRFEKEGINLA